MTRIKALRESIRRTLEAACGIKFYSEFAPGWVRPPFGVFSLLLMREGEAQATYDLMVNIAASGGDADGVEALAEACAENLNYCDYFDATQSWTAYLGSVAPVDHADETLQQVRLSFTINYIRRQTE